jgi:hypothetical protein
LIPGEGGGFGYTYWEAYDIEAIHELVQGVSDDQLETSWQQVSAWKKTKELLETHAGTLGFYRQGLVENWPPEKSPASAAFVKYVDDLIASLRQASKAADDNVRALADLTSGVSTARTEVKKAYQEYATNQAKVDATPPPPAPMGQRTPTPTPSPAPSPIPPGRQEDLTRRARAAMATLSGTAVDSTRRMTVPPPYAPPRQDRRDGWEHIDAPSVVATQPPIVPSPRAAASQFSTARSDLPGHPGSGALPTDSAPILSGGVLTPPAPPPTFTPPAPLPNPVPPGVPLPPSLVPGFPSAPGPSGSTKPLRDVASSARRGPFGGGGGNGFIGPGPAAPAEGRGSGQARPLPPGGVIGGLPGMGGANTGGGGSRGGSGTAPRVNPASGVLWQGAQAGGSGGTHGLAGGDAPGQPFLGGQPGGSRRRDDGPRAWDPDDPWAVEHGVDSVIAPGRERSTHDPGPGVIGIDR